MWLIRYRARQRLVESASDLRVLVKKVAAGDFEVSRATSEYGRNNADVPDGMDERKFLKLAVAVEKVPDRGASFQVLCEKQVRLPRERQWAIPCDPGQYVLLA